jgi:hypothetical protein
MSLFPLPFLVPGYHQYAVILKAVYSSLLIELLTRYAIRVVVDGCESNAICILAS